MWSALAATWEWCRVAAVGVSIPVEGEWENCTPNTCKHLQTLFEKGDAALASPVVFIDCFGTSRKFTCVAHDGSLLTLFHGKVRHEEDGVTLLVRRITRKLWAAQYKKEDDTIEIYSLLTGSVVTGMPFSEHAVHNWGFLVRQLESKMELPDGRVHLFPGHMTDPDEMAAWKRKPNNRLQVRSVLKVVEKEMTVSLKSYVKKRPASSMTGR